MTGQEPRRRNRLSRRELLRGALATGAGAMAAGSLAGSQAAAAAQATHRVDPADDEAIEALARRLREGDVKTLPEGTVVVDGWYLPAAYVRLLEGRERGR